MAPNKEKALTEILLCINSGKNYSETLQEICSKFQVKERTFNNYWKEAKERHQETQEAVRMRIADKTAQADEKAAEKGVIERLERLQILTSIARGEAQKQITPGDRPAEERTKYVFPSIAEVNKAIDMLTRMGEGYSPVKKDFQVDTTRDFVINIE